MDHTFRPDILERIITVVSPKWAADRAAQRMRLDILSKRHYDAGAVYNRQFEGWRTPVVSSANTQTRGSLLWLRERSRDLVRNNPYAKKAIQVLTTNCIGEGIQPSIPKNLLNKTQEANLMNAWNLWAGEKACDYVEQFDFYAIQAQAWRAVAESGECFIRKSIDSKAKFPLKLQLLEADFCDLMRDGYPTADGGYMNQGVEFDKNGKRVAYWMFEKHPADLQPYTKNLLSVRVPANEIIHIYEQLRPGQVRGVPQGVAAITRLKNLDDYEEAQLIRQKIAACFSVFIRKNDVNFIEKYDIDKEVAVDPLSEKVSPGTIDYLAPGEDVTFANPPGASGYDQYTETIIRSIAIAYGITYESLSGNLTNVNFSSGRMGWLEMHRQIKQWQKLVIIPMLCKEVWNEFIKVAMIKGIIPKPISATWTPPRREMIDPVKETKGMVDGIRAGITSREEVIRELGDNPEIVNAAILAERNQARENDLYFEGDPYNDAARVNFGKQAAIELKKAGVSQRGSKPPKSSAK